VVTLFLLTVFGLLLGAGIKSRMEKAGLDTSIPWSTGRRWWEEWVPRRQPEGFSLNDRTFRRPRDRDGRERDYVSLPEGLD
jgi:hypothetical protein